MSGFVTAQKRSFAAQQIAGRSGRAQQFATICNIKRGKLNAELRGDINHGIIGSVWMGRLLASHEGNRESEASGRDALAPRPIRSTHIHNPVSQALFAEHDAELAGRGDLFQFAQMQQRRVVGVAQPCCFLSPRDDARLDRSCANARYHSFQADCIDVSAHINRSPVRRASVEPNEIGCVPLFFPGRTLGHG